MDHGDIAVHQDPITVPSPFISCTSEMGGKTQGNPLGWCRLAQGKGINKEISMITPRMIQHMCHWYGCISGKGVIVSNNQDWAFNSSCLFLQVKH